MWGVQRGTQYKVLPFVHRIRPIALSLSFYRDSLQDHVANSHWHSPTWDVSHEKPLRRFVIPQDITSHSPFSTMPPPNYSPSSLQSTSISQYPNLITPAPSRTFQVPNFGRLNYSTPGSSSALSSDAILPRSTTSSMTSDASIPMVGFPPSSNPFSHRRSSTSVSSIVSYHTRHLYFKSTLWHEFFFFLDLRVINRAFIALHTNESTRPPARTLWPLPFLWSVTAVNPSRVDIKNNGTAARAWWWWMANIYASRREEHAWCRKRLFYRKCSKLILSWFTYPLSPLLVFKLFLTKIICLLSGMCLERQRSAPAESC